MSEEAFLQSIAEDPYDVTRRLVFADWLEDQGDARAQVVRERCRFRMPMDDRELKRFAVWKTARATATGNVVDVLPDPELGRLVASGHEGLVRLEDDVANLNREAIHRHFPRVDDGRLQLGQSVLLATYPAAGPLPRFRQLWLTAQGPDRRKDPQRISVRLSLEIGENHEHNWIRHRHHWDQRISDQSIAETRPSRVITPADRSEWLETHPIVAANAPLEDRIAHCIALQDEGRLEPALVLFGVRVDSRVSEILNGDFDDFRWDPKQAQARAIWLRRQLWETAPWNLYTAWATFSELRRSWGAQSGLLRSVRLGALPQQGTLRKWSLMLGQYGTGIATLSVELIGSNLYVPECLWKRPIDWDVERLAGG